MHEKLGWCSVLGLVAAAFGVGLVLSSSIGGAPGFFAGDLVVLASGGIFAVQTILQKLTFPKIPPATLLLNQSILACPLFFLFSGTFEGFANYHFSRNVVLALAYQGVAVSGVCFSIWMLLLKRYPAGQLATIAFITPMFERGIRPMAQGRASDGSAGRRRDPRGDRHLPHFIGPRRPRKAGRDRIARRGRPLILADLGNTRRSGR